MSDPFPPEDASTPPKPSRPDSLPPHAVWIVDPDRDARDSLMKRAAAAGYEATASESPVALLREFRGDPGCVLLVDEYGDEATAELLAAFVDRGWATPVIVLTTSIDPAWIVRLIRIGAFTVLKRTESARRLVAAMEEAIAEDARRRRLEAMQLDLRHRIDALSRSELDVLKLLVAGCSNKIVAARLNVSERTIESRRSGLYAHFGVESLAQLVAAVCAAAHPRLPTYPIVLPDDQR